MCVVTRLPSRIGSVPISYDVHLDGDRSQRSNIEVVVQYLVVWKLGGVQLDGAEEASLI